MKPRRDTTKDATIIEAVKRKEPYADIAARLGVSKATVCRVWQRCVDRAMAEPVAFCGPPATDSQTGQTIEITDDLVLAVALRELGGMFRRSTDVAEKLAIADRLPKLALARHRIRPSNQPAQGGKLYTVLASPDDWPEPNEAMVKWIDSDR